MATTNVVYTGCELNMKQDIIEYDGITTLKIVNLTQHTTTEEQIEAGVITPRKNATAIRKALTFDKIPVKAEILERAILLAGYAEDELIQPPEYIDVTDDPDIFGDYELPPKSAAMIGGAPYLMAPLEEALRNRGIQPIYAFSFRESNEQIQPDGSVKKTIEFRHIGFVMDNITHIIMDGQIYEDECIRCPECGAMAFYTAETDTFVCSDCDYESEPFENNLECFIYERER